MNVINFFFFKKIKLKSDCGRKRKEGDTLWYFPYFPSYFNGLIEIWKNKKNAN